MGTIFSLRIVEFPTLLHMHYVLKYMFIVSVTVIVPLIGLVIYTTRLTITKLIIRLNKRIVNLKFWHQMKRDRRKVKWEKKKREANDVDSLSTAADVTDVRPIRKRKPFWRKKKADLVAVDAEKGEHLEVINGKH